MGNALEVYSAISYYYDGTQFVSPHSHKAIYQIYYLVDKPGEFNYDGKRVKIPKGGMLLAEPGKEHGIIGCVNGRLIDIKFKAYEEKLENIISKISGVSLVQKEVTNLFSGIVELVERQRLCFTKVVALNLEAIIYLQYYSQEDKTQEVNSVESTVWPSDKNGYSVCVQRALPFIEGFVVSPVEKFSIKKLGSQIGYNKDYISRKFSEEVGMSVAHYYRILRIKKAKELLENTELKTGAIAELLCYEDASHFAKDFQKYVGVSPQTYKKNSK